MKKAPMSGQLRPDMGVFIHNRLFSFWGVLIDDKRIDYINFSASKKISVAISCKERYNCIRKGVCR